MIDTKFIGYEMPAHSVEIKKGRLRLFAKAIGQNDPAYTDDNAARTAGYRSLPVPPTMLFGLDIEAPAWFGTFAAMGVATRSL